MTQEFNKIDTFAIQAESLLRVMQVLGFRPHRENGGFISSFHKANRVISTRTAIRLHNLTINEWTAYSEGLGNDAIMYAPEGINVAFSLTPEGRDIVLASKLVHKVKFNPSRKEPNGIVLQSHIIRPCEGIEVEGLDY
jgi:hypothetical protein